MGMLAKWLPANTIDNKLRVVAAKRARRNGVLRDNVQDAQVRMAKASPMMVPPNVANQAKKRVY